MQCPKCQFENPDDARFCIECASQMESPCPSCGTITPATGKFCKECGYDLKKPKENPPSISYSEPQSYTPKFLADKILTLKSSMEGERKIVTVLFADVANYTAISEKLDPEEVHQIMDGCFKILMDEIHKFEGTINQFTGDGVMALFGAPLAHEDHAQRACYSALSIQNAFCDYGEKLRKDFAIEFKIRIGINSGPVIVGAIGDDLRMDYTAIGDTTNLASRLENEARPGSILISENTHKIARLFFQFDWVGKIEIKGKQEPQDAYELIKTGDIETRIKASEAKGLTKFVGRENSKAALIDSYERMLSGSGQVVGIVGEAGIGKSRLLFEFINQLPQNEVTYHEGRCLHYGSGMVYLPMIDLVRSFFGIKDGDREFVVKKKLEKNILQLDQQLVGTLPAFQELLSTKVEDEKYLQLDPSQKKIRIFEAIRDLFIRESEHKPLILAIEDLHWIDKASEECLSYLIDWQANARIMLILLYRLEYTHQWGSKSHYTKIGMSQLGNVSSRKLVQAILAESEVVPELRELILSRAGGNPLYVEELTHNLLENGLIDRKGSQFVLTHKATEIKVPDTIQGIIAARIDRVEDDMKRVMQVASVIGREFAFQILQNIMGMREELKSHLLNLQGLEFISEKRLFPELEYIFKHALTQEVAYNSLLQNRREAIHESIGQAIESLYPERLEEYYELLAYHYSRSKNTEKVVQYLELANQRAIQTLAVEQAKQYFDDAMSYLDTLPETEDNQRRRISLLTNQILVMLHLFKYPEYHDLLTRFEYMAARLKDKGLQGAYYGRLGSCEWGYGNFDLAIQLNTKAVELCEAAGDDLEAAIAYAQMQWCHQYKGDFDQVLLLKERSLDAMGDRFYLPNYSWALVAAAGAYTGLGYWDKAQEECFQLMEVAEKFSDNSIIASAANGLCYAYIYQKDSAKAIKYGELAVKKAITPGDKIWAECLLASVWCRTGEIQKGIEYLSNAIPLIRAVQFLPCGFFSMFLGEGYFLNGEYEKAKKVFEEYLQIIDGRDMKWETGIVHYFLGEIAMKTEPKRAPNHFDTSIAQFKKIKAKNDLALAYAGYGRYHKHIGEMAKAYEYLTQALDIFERLGTLIEPEKVKAELDELPKT